MRMLRDGDIISTPVYGVIDHWGVYAGNGSVISNSKRHGKVVEESLSSFLNGKPLSLIGYPSTLPGYEVISKARELVGEKWNLVKSNCEHFAHHVHGLKPTSPQLLLGVASMAVLVLLMVIR